MWQWGKLKHEFRLARRFLIGLRRSFIILRQIDHMGTALAIDRQIHLADQQPASGAFDIPESHKQTVRQRVKKYTKKPSVDWEKAQKIIKGS
jgi:hypothetical protein